MPNGATEETTEAPSKRSFASERASRATLVPRIFRMLLKLGQVIVGTKGFGLYRQVR